jgi:hypothetical protein
MVLEICRVGSTNKWMEISGNGEIELSRNEDILEVNCLYIFRSKLKEREVVEREARESSVTPLVQRAPRPPI